MRQLSGQLPRLVSLTTEATAFVPRTAREDESRRALSGCRDVASTDAALIGNQPAWGRHICHPLSHDRQPSKPAKQVSRGIRGLRRIHRAEHSLFNSSSCETIDPRVGRLPEKHPGRRSVAEPVGADPHTVAAHRLASRPAAGY
jgi:hypothetical protein